MGTRRDVRNGAAVANGEPAKRREPRPRTPQGEERAEAFRNGVLAVAADLFGTQGYAATSTRQLTEVLGTTTGGLYYHFDGKEDVLFAICESALVKITTSVRAALSGVEDPIECLETLIRFHTKAMLGDQNLHRTMLIELRSLSGDRYNVIRDMRRDYSQVVVGVLTACQRAGLVRSDIPARMLALLLLNTLNWSIFWFQPDGLLTPDELGEWILRVFVEGAANGLQEESKLDRKKRTSPRRTSAR